LWMSLRSLVFMNRFFIIDPPQADLKYSIENIQSFEDSENISLQLFCYKIDKKNF